MAPKRGQKGFTLIEILVYFALLGLFLTSTTNFYLTILHNSIDEISVGSVNQDARYILAKLAYEIRNSDGLRYPTSPGEISSESCSGTDSQGLVLWVTKNSTDKKICINGSNQLVLRKSDGNQYVLNSSETIVTAFQARYLGVSGKTPSIELDFTLRSTTMGKGADPTNEKNYSLTVALREL